MTLAPAKVRWLTPVAYPLTGLLLGLADPLLGQLAQQLGTKPGVATAVSVNLLLPLVAVALAVINARLPGIWLGSVSMTLGLVVGLAAQYHGGREWSVFGLLGAVPPVLVAATVGYAALGTIAAVVTRRACSSD
jgi:hypothetical protein